MPQGKINWNQSEKGVTTTLTLNCNRDGSVEMETPQSHGGYSAKFGSPDEAAQNIAERLAEGTTQAGRL